MVREVAAVASSEGSSELWRRQEALEAAVSSGGVSELWGRQAVHSHIFAEWQCVRQCSYDFAFGIAKGVSKERRGEMSARSTRANGSVDCNSSHAEKARKNTSKKATLKESSRKGLVQWNVGVGLFEVLG